MYYISPLAMGGLCGPGSSRTVGLSTRGNSSITIKFMPGLYHVQDFHERVMAMGIQILENTAGEQVSLPHAVPQGNADGPSLKVFFQLAPQVKLSMQFHTKTKIVTVQGRRDVVDAQLGLLLVFMGGVVDVANSAPRRASGQARGQRLPAPAAERSDRRERLAREIAQAPGQHSLDAWAFRAP